MRGEDLQMRRRTAARQAARRGHEYGYYDEEGEIFSVADQLAACHALCKRLRWTSTIRAVCAVLSGYGLVWFAMEACVGGECGTFAVPKLLYIMCGHMLLSALALDEGLLLNHMALKSRVPPFAVRLLMPGMPVTPAFSGLPREQSALGSAAYLCYIIATVHALASPADFGGKQIAASVFLFFAASIFDVGLLISSRPADILKFIFIISITGKTSAAWLLLGFLYVNSGIAKVRGFFWGFTLPFHFLLPSHVSWYLQRTYLLDDHTPSLFASVLGFTAALSEAILGGLMLSGVPNLLLPCAMLASIVHVYIVFWGVGPHRLNHVHIYLVWVCFHGLPREDHLALDIDWPIWPYVAIYGIVFPLVGFFYPTTLGRYFGGYRMATFQYVGNEAVFGFFLHRSVSQRLRAECVRWDAKLARKRRPWNALLAERARAPGGLVQDQGLLQMMYFCDGMDFAPVVCEAARLVEIPLDQFAAEYVWVSMRSLNTEWALLNTKWDELVSPVSQRFIEALWDGLEPLEGGDVILFQAFPLAYTDKMKKWALRDMVMGDKVERVFACAGVFVHTKRAV